MKNNSRKNDISVIKAYNHYVPNSTYDPARIMIRTGLRRMTVWMDGMRRDEFKRMRVDYNLKHRK
jgi:hypothetical protein